jgi:hypothetical protein
MMPGLAKDVISLLQALLPGFVAAWVFYGLTAYKKPDAFERAVQALVYTLIIHAMTYLVMVVLTCAGTALNWGMEWTTDSQLIWSVILALAFGVVISVCANNNSVHKVFTCRNWWFRVASDNNMWSWTKQSAYPSEWFRAFNEGPSWVVLHLNDGRRFYGYALEWPNCHDVGHFLLRSGKWSVMVDGKLCEQDVGNVWATLIPASEVKFVDFVTEFQKPINQKEEEKDD